MLTAPPQSAGNFFGRRSAALPARASTSSRQRVPVEVPVWCHPAGHHVECAHGFRKAWQDLAATTTKSATPTPTLACCSGGATGPAPGTSQNVRVIGLQRAPAQPGMNRSDRGVPVGVRPTSRPAAGPLPALYRLYVSQTSGMPEFARHLPLFCLSIFDGCILDRAPPHRW